MAIIYWLIGSIALVALVATFIVVIQRSLGQR
jgi:hypothetical protein